VAGQHCSVYWRIFIIIYYILLVHKGYRNYYRSESYLHVFGIYYINHLNKPRLNCHLNIYQFIHIQVLQLIAAHNIFTSWARRAIIIIESLFIIYMLYTLLLLWFFYIFCVLIETCVLYSYKEHNLYLLLCKVKSNNRILIYYSQ